MSTRFSGYEIKRVESNCHGKTVLDVVVGTSLVFTCGSDCSVAVWDIKTFECIKRISKLDGWVVKCVISPQEDYLLCCAGDKLYFFEIASGDYRKVCEISTNSGAVSVK
jgi:WD40 repeat protein